MDKVRTAECKAASSTNLKRGVQQSYSESPCSHFQGDCPEHDQGVKERVAYGHIAGIGH